MFHLCRNYQGRQLLDEQLESLFAGIDIEVILFKRISESFVHGIHIMSQVCFSKARLYIEQVHTSYAFMIVNDTLV